MRKKELMTYSSKTGQNYYPILQGMEQAFNKMSPEIKAILLKSCEVVAYLNAGESAKKTLENIQVQHPELTNVFLKEVLAASTSILAIGKDVQECSEVEAAIEIIQHFLMGLEGKNWAAASGVLAKLLAGCFAPALNWDGIELPMYHVYQSYAKS